MRAFSALIVIVGITLFAAGQAQAADNKPCGAPFYSSTAGGQVRYCPDWSPSGTIPVMDTIINAGNFKVGQMNHTGNKTNWYVCQLPGERVYLNGFYNSWWALSMADNGEWGWVNEVYFQGGNNDERDATLPPC